MSKNKRDALFMVNVAMIVLIFYGYSVIGIGVNAGSIIGVLLGMIINYVRGKDAKRKKNDKYILIVILALTILAMNFIFGEKIHWEKLLYIGPVLVAGVFLFDFVERRIINKFEDKGVG